MLFPDPAVQVGDGQISIRKRKEGPTFSMNPQERADRHPVFERLALKEPRGRSLLVGLARNVVIRGRVRRREPDVNVLFYLCPCAEDSISTTEAMRVGYYRHFTSSTSFEICLIAILVLSAPRRTSI